MDRVLKLVDERSVPEPNTGCWHAAPEHSRHGRKGRRAYGTSVKNAKLTELHVQHLRAQYAAGVSCRAIGRQLGVSDTLISRIVRGTRWPHVNASP